MSNAKRTQLLVLAGAVVLIIALYFAPGKVEQKDSGTTGEENNGHQKSAGR